MKPLALRLALVASLASASASAADQILTFDGLGRVRVGMTVPEAEAALGVKLMPLDTNDGVSEESCWFTRRTDGVDQALPYMIQYGRIVRIDVTNGLSGKLKAVDPGVRTERGIGIGSSEEDVKKAYGSNLNITPHAYGDEDDHYLTILTADKSRGIRFETWDGKVSHFHVGAADAILLVEGCS